ncbi:MAG: hypothetical protein JEZ02_05260 [Desulfatibacillum sp.]|nr:hypothetical protein [Desulfatibacillum sp.]
MEQNHHSLVFTGQVTSGQDPESVKANIVSMFKLSPAGVERLFRGGPVVVKKGLDPEKARKFQLAFAKAGAKCKIVPEKQGTGKVKMQSPRPAAPTPAVSASKPKAAVAPKSHASPFAENESAGPPPKVLSEEDAIRAKAKQLYVRFDEAYDRALKKNNVNQTTNVYFGVALVFCAIAIAACIFTSLRWYWALLINIVLLGIYGVYASSVNKTFIRGFVDPMFKRSNDPGLFIASYVMWAAMMRDTPLKSDMMAVGSDLAQENPRFRAKLKEYDPILEKEFIKDSDWQDVPELRDIQAERETPQRREPARVTAPQAPALRGLASGAPHGPKMESPDPGGRASSLHEAFPSQSSAPPPQAPEEALSKEIRYQISLLLNLDFSRVPLDAALPLSQNPAIAKKQLDDLLENLETKYGCVLPFNAADGVATVADVVHAMVTELEAEGKLPGQERAENDSQEKDDDDEGHTTRKTPFWIALVSFLIAAIIVVPFAQAGASAIGLHGNWAKGASLFAGVIAWGLIAEILDTGK